MDQEEKNKEINWLVGSIKRDYARMSSKSVQTYIALIIIFAVYIFCFAIYDSELFSFPWILFGIFVALFLLVTGAIEFVTRKRIEKVEDSRELLKIIDQRHKYDMVCLGLAIVFGLVVAYFLFDKEDPKTFAKDFIILLTIITLSRTGTGKWIWWILSLLLTVCLIFLGEVFLGIVLAIMVIVNFLYRKYTGYHPDNDGPQEEIKQLRELLKEGK